MGAALRKLLGVFDSLATKERRILLLGLDAAGKTAILYRFKLGEVLSTVPTIGFNVEHIRYKSLEFTVWDVGGQDKIRALWRHYYPHTDALIWVVDSNDQERLRTEAADALQKLMKEHDLADVPVLVLANKQDLPNAAPIAQVAHDLGLSNMQNRTWFVQGTSATTGDGLYEGMDWLANTLNKAR